MECFHVFVCVDDGVLGRVHRFEGRSSGVEPVGQWNETGVKTLFIKGNTAYLGCDKRLVILGSTLDTKRGIFYWSPGVGFLGAYELEFVKDYGYGEAGKIKVTVRIVPRF